MGAKISEAKRQLAPAVLVRRSVKPSPRERRNVKVTIHMNSGHNIGNIRKYQKIDF